MTKLLFTFCLTLALLPVFAQQDFYVVDSLYCHAHNGGVATPTERQYNLAFLTTGEVLESRREKYLPWLGQWRNSAHLSYSYNSQNVLVQLVEQSWDTLQNAWVNLKMTEYTPNQNGDYTQELNKVWDGQAWQNQDRINSVFGSNGYIETLTQQLWENGAWRNNLRIIYATNPNGDFVLTKFQLWNVATNSFYDVNRQTYFYDMDFPEREIRQVTEVFDQATLQWANSSRIDISYDSQGNPTEQTSQLWVTQDSVWSNSNRIVQNFSASNLVTLRTEFVWNGSQWVNFFQVNNVYDAEDNLTRFEVSQWDVNQWVLLTSCDFYPRFHHEVLAANEPLTVPCAWPNPYRLGTPVQCPHFAEGGAKLLAVYDFSGQLQHLQNIENQSVVELNADLPAGLYLVKINGEGGRFAPQKLMIIK
ncbi:MAG: T9SS type A sorting domain-containing protein [Saprospiraceae bacterium]|nr:T9SS type A sorting domain-containing protein [Saprospiraceae bacterium]